MTAAKEAKWLFISNTKTFFHSSLPWPLKIFPIFVVFEWLVLPFFIPTYVPIFNRTLLSWLVNFSIPSAICTEPVTHFTPIVILAGNFCTRKMLCKISDFATNPALCTTTVHLFVLFSLYCHGMEGRRQEEY